MTFDATSLVTMTADIVSAHVENNSVAVSDVPSLISTVYASLAKLSAPAAEAAPEKPKNPISVRASIKPDHLISMIDGKPYRMLRRHLNRNGYTPDSYREAFGLPRDYPMVSATYAETRREMAKKNGLGRKPKAVELELEKLAKKPRAKKKAIATDAAAQEHHE